VRGALANLRDIFTIFAAEESNHPQRHTTKAPPANVIEEIRSWFASCRRLPVRHTHLIGAVGRETSVRLQRLLGSDCAPLTGTLLEWRVSRIGPKLRKQLNEQGLFLD
jgi:hypothetical protein